MQGDYIAYFQDKIPYLFPLIWQKASSQAEKIKLLKIFKIWDMFFEKQILDRIAATLSLDKFVAKFLSEQDLQKIQMFKAEFFPNMESVPDHLFEQGKVVAGSKYS